VKTSSDPVHLQIAKIQAETQLLDNAVRLAKKGTALILYPDLTAYENDSLAISFETKKVCARSDVWLALYFQFNVKQIEIARITDSDVKSVHQFFGNPPRHQDAWINLDKETKEQAVKLAMMLALFYKAKDRNQHFVSEQTYVRMERHAEERHNETAAEVS
jgi:hypothetical protein